MTRMKLDQLEYLITINFKPHKSEAYTLGQSPKISQKDNDSTSTPNICHQILLMIFNNDLYIRSKSERQLSCCAAEKRYENREDKRCQVFCKI